MLGFAALMASSPGRTYVVRRFRGGRQIRRVLIGTALAGAPFSLAVAFVPNMPSWMATAWLMIVIGTLTATVVVLLTRRIAPECGHSPRRVLALAAHPDDLELACGATLARLVDAGHEVRAVIMSQGSAGGDASLRPDEARVAGAFLGVDDVTICDLPDTNLQLASGELIRIIETAIGQHRPHIILTHSANDQHQDHYAVHQATLRAARHHHSILCYESPSATKEFSPAVFVDVGEYVQVKVESVLTHRDQAGKPYMTPDVVEGIVTFRGRQAKLGRAEGFEVVRLLANESGVF